MGFKYKLDIQNDNTARIEAHKNNIKSKLFLQSLYKEWYKVFANEIALLPEGKVVEVGSGGGFLKEIIPEIITSDVLYSPDNDLTFSALDMPFKNCSVSGIFMLDVFHHLADADRFLREANRVLKEKGKLVMIEPANTNWGRFVYKNFHHEPFHPDGSWDISETDPPMEANGALPWIVFFRDINLFKLRFPGMVIESTTFHTPLRYILSGGVTYKQIVPDFSYRFFSMLDKTLCSMSTQFSMFMTIKVLKVE